MKRNPMRTAVSAMMAIAVAVPLSACGPRQSLDTATAREDAVSIAFGEIADAMQERDIAAIRQLTCAHPSLIELPPAVTEESGRLAVSISEIRELEIHDTTYVEPDPDAEFHIAMLNDSAPGVDGFDRIFVEAVVRVDDQRACLWSLGNTMLTSAAL